MKALFGALVIAVLAIVVTGRGRPGERPAAATSARLPAATASCAVIANPPRFVPGGTIAGRGVYRCDSPGALLYMNVFVQRRNANGSWTTLTQQSIRASGTATTRSRTDSQRSATASVACAPGTFRTVATTRFTFSGQRQRTDESASNPVVNPCAG